VNVERVHAVARQAHEELESQGVVRSLTVLQEGLRGLTNQPGDAQSQAQISEARTALQVLANAPSNDWPSSDRQVAEELGLVEVMGDSLLESIEAVLARNEMTPAVADGEITPLAEQVTSTVSQLSTMVSAFAHFGIGADEPRGDAEIILTIPRSAVHDELRELGEEFQTLWKILVPFQELTTGTRSGIPVGTISSTAFGLELLAAPAVAYGVAKAVNEILSVYKNILDIRQARNELKASGLPDDALEAVDAHANSLMGERTSSLADDLLSEFAVAQPLDPGRRNELTIELRLSLNALANRIDSGYEIDVRAPSPPDEASDENPNDDVTGEPSDREFQRRIRDLSPTLRSERPIGSSILSLPEGSAPSEDDSEVPPT
jgi:hypothetical protein